MFPESRDQKAIDAEWHERGARAKESTFSLAEWSEQEITRWDLDEDSRRPTGRENPRSYQIDRPIDTLGENGADIRDDPRR